MRYYMLVLLLFLPSLLLSTTLKKLHFKNNNTFTDAQLYTALGIITPAFYQFWKDKVPNINEKIIPSLQESLEYFYKSEGFYHTSIEKDETNSSVTFKIQEGKSVHIANISIKSDEDISNFISFKKHQRFRALEFSQIKKDIKKALLKRGYCNYQLDSKARVDIEKDIVNLIYKLTKNKPCKFGKITIKTPDTIKEKVVRSRILFQTGDRYDIEKVNRTYSMISGLEAFDGIQLNSDKEHNIIDIGLTLNEKRKKTRIEAGIGYETDIGPRGILRYEKRNFEGDARKISFDLKYSQKEKYLKNSLFWPAFIHVPIKGYYYLDLKNDFLISQFDYKNFLEKKLANHLHLLKDYDWYSVDFGIGYERINIKKTTDSDMCGVADGNFNLFFPFANVNIDLRDSKLNPKNGFYFSQYFELGIDILSNSSTYSESITEARAIKTLNQFTLALKGKIGLIEEYANHLPESKLLFAGGAFSNRGYGYNRLGAFDGVCNNIGGKTLIDTTVELIHPLYKKIDGAIFLDSTLLSKEAYRFSIDFVHSLGVGMRYNTPIGPVKLDVGMDVDDSSQYAIHFQIGQSF